MKINMNINKNTYISGFLPRPHRDLTGIMVNKGNHPQMALIFRLVKYDDLPMYIYIFYILHMIYIYISYV